MKIFLVIVLQFFIVGLNVRVSEGAPVTAGYFSLRVPCGAAAPMIATLTDKYHERLAFKGVTTVGIMKFYANERTSTFTVFFENGDTACLVMAGQYLIKETNGTEL